jgi:hypothetical protein
MQSPRRISLRGASVAVCDRDVCALEAEALDAAAAAREEAVETPVRVT